MSAERSGGLRRSPRSEDFGTVQGARGSARDGMCRQEPERGSEDGSGAREGEHVTEGARGQGSNRSWPGGGGAGGARAPCKMRAMPSQVGDDLEDAHLSLIHISEPTRPY